MNTPKYSVVVPIHNIDEQYLKKCVESILGQTLPDLELILVDDGSTDESGALCDSYVPRDARVRVFHKKNGGVSSARNVGIREARGELITFLDADDFWDVSFLEKINALTNAFPQIDFFCSAYEKFKTDANGNYQVAENGAFYHKEISPGDVLVFDAISYASNKKRWCCACTGSSVFRTKAVRENINGGEFFSENLDSGEDGKFHFDMALRGRICLLNEILMHYRIDVPAEKKARRQKTKSMQSAWVSHLNEYDELLKSRPEIRRYLDKLRLGTTLAYRGNPIFKNEIKAILRQVSPENWTLSFRLLHWVPYSFQKAISALWHRVKRVIR